MRVFFSHLLLVGATFLSFFFCDTPHSLLLPWTVCQRFIGYWKGVLVTTLPFVCHLCWGLALMPQCYNKRQLSVFVLFLGSGLHSW